MTGLPGSGKSLNAVSIARKEANNGRKIYTNIRGLLVPHIGIADWVKSDDKGNCSADLSKFKSIEEKSVVIIDEAHRYFGSGAGRGMSTELRDWLATHRHLGLDLFFIYQSVQQITAQVRVLVGEHWYYRRATMLGQKGKSFLNVYVGGMKGEKSAIAHNTKYLKDDKSVYALYKSDVIGGAGDVVGLGNSRIILAPLFGLAVVVVAFFVLFGRVGGLFSDEPDNDDKFSHDTVLPGIPGKDDFVETSSKVKEGSLLVNVKVCYGVNLLCYTYDTLDNSILKTTSLRRALLE